MTLIIQAIPDRDDWEVTDDEITAFLQPRGLRLDIVTTMKDGVIEHPESALDAAIRTLAVRAAETHNTAEDALAFAQAAQALTACR